MDKLLESIIEYARTHEKPSRFRHTEGVVKAAEELCLKYGGDTGKAVFASWAHDMARSAGNLEHGPAAAEILEKDFGITDEDILNAVRYHTIGRVGMSDLEKIVYVADAIEEGRDYPSAEKYRLIARTDISLNELTYTVMINTRNYVQSLGLDFDERSNDTIEWLSGLIRKEN